MAFDFDRDNLIAAAELVHRHMAPTAQFAWPLLCEALGTEVWLKHENHTQTGAFKIRGGITLIDWLKRSQPQTRGVVTATRGNHGQSQALAARRANLHCRVYVPQGNSVEKNAAMRAFGAELIEFGADFDTARVEAMRVAEAEQLFAVPPFHEQLVRGVASYALELFAGAPALDTVYVPIGCGSGICGLIAARDALGLSTEIVGVVSTGAPAAKRAFESGVLVQTESASTFADGMAVRVVVPEAFEIYRRGTARIVAVTDDEVADAVRLIYRTTHNVAEGAGAAPVAAALQERAQLNDKRIACILCGGNIDTNIFAQILQGETPVP
ncbi:MAG: threonine dehydratase [Pseudomonadota bacterium]